MWRGLFYPRWGQAPFQKLVRANLLRPIRQPWLEKSPQKALGAASSNFQTKFNFRVKPKAVSPGKQPGPHQKKRPVHKRRSRLLGLGGFDLVNLSSFCWGSIGLGLGLWGIGRWEK